MSAYFTFTKSIPLLTLSIAALLSACGGSDNKSGDLGENRNLDSFSIEGAVFASKVNGAIVNIEDSLSNRIGGTASSNAEGVYVLNVDANDAQLGSYFLKSSGGTYIDEATGDTKNAGELMAYIDSDILVDNKVNLTPGSTIIARLIKDEGLSSEQAYTHFEKAFSYRPDISLTPIDVTEDGSSNANAKQRLAGLRAAAFSQLAADLGFDQFDLLKAMARDLADGELDGENSGNHVFVGDSIDRHLPEDVRVKHVGGLMSFFLSERNKSGLGNAEIGTLPQFDAVKTASYKVKYIPAEEEQATMGRNAFTLKVTDHDGVAVTGKEISLKPLMNMSGHKHTTAFSSVEEGVEGHYSGDIYYVMASQMASGDTMGWWQLSVCIGEDGPMSMPMPMATMDMPGMSVCPMGSEEAVFYPSVTMKMGVRATVKGGGNDQIPTMIESETQARSYHLFKHSAVEGMGDAMGTYHAHVYIAAVESMHNFPGLNVGTVLNAGTDSELAVNTIAVEFSNDEGVTWTAASNGHGGGLWAADMSGMAGTMQIRLAINGEVKMLGDADHAELDMGADMGEMEHMGH